MIVDEAVKLARSHQPPFELGFDQASKCLPDKPWLLFILSTLNPTHPFFAKNYVAPKKEKVPKMGMALDNSDGFFSGLEGI